MVLDYINKYGMDPEMGLFSIEVLQEGHDGKLVDKCRSMMKLLYKETSELLKSNQELLENITSELLVKESLNGNEIDDLCA